MEYQSPYAWGWALNSPKVIYIKRSETTSFYLIRWHWIRPPPWKMPNLPWHAFAVANIKEASFLIVFASVLNYTLISVVIKCGDKRKYEMKEPIDPVDSLTEESRLNSIRTTENMVLLSINRFNWKLSNLFSNNTQVILFARWNR